MKILVFLLALVLLTVPASAELTMTEKNSVKELHIAGTHLETAFGGYVNLMVRETSATNRAAHVALWANGVAGYHELHYAIAMLLGVVTDGKTAATPRADYIARAWYRIDRGLLNIAAAQVALTTATQVPGLSPTYSNAVTRAGMSLVSARAALLRVDRALPYADPRPASYPEIIGPHGNYDAASRAISEALTFLWESMDMTRLGAIYASGPFASYYPFDRALVRVTVVTAKYRRALLNWALIPVDATQCAMNRFHLVASSLGPLTSHTSESGGIAGAPYHIDIWLAETHLPLLAIVVETSTLGGQLRNAINRVSTAWRYADGAAWRVLQFPDPARLAIISGQTLPEAQPFAPPLCS